MQRPMRMISCLFGVLVMVSTAAQTVAQTAATRPADPATTSAAPSTPRDALVNLAKAMEAGDVAAMRANLLAENDSEKQMLELLLGLAAAQRDVRQAAATRFGKESGDLTAAPKANETIALIDTGLTTINANEATVRTDGGEMLVKRVDGQWKVPMSYVARGSSFDSERRMADVKRMTEIFRQGASDIQAGKYRSADDAADGLRMKLRAAATQPVTTQPATGPATRP